MSPRGDIGVEVLESQRIPLHKDLWRIDRAQNSGTRAKDYSLTDATDFSEPCCLDVTLTRRETRPNAVKPTLRAAR
jgi:hypothetical protein